MFKWKKLMKSGSIVSSDSSCTSSNESIIQTPPLTPTHSYPSSESCNAVDGFGKRKSDMIRTVSDNFTIVVENDRDREKDSRRKKRKVANNHKCNKSDINVSADVAVPPSCIEISRHHHIESRPLATQEDEIYVNALHCFVRQNIQVFTASTKDINIPAPGRKTRIFPGQVGLRCIHCKDLSSKDRVKRAVCYPTSVNRIYHSVSDMKFDHFTACKSMPQDVKDRFIELKDQFKGRSVPSNQPSSTSQYYLNSAKSLGMTDMLGGIYMKSNNVNSLPNLPSSNHVVSSSPSSVVSMSRNDANKETNAILHVPSRNIKTIAYSMKAKEETSKEPESTEKVSAMKTPTYPPYFPPILPNQFYPNYIPHQSQCIPTSHPQMNEHESNVNTNSLMQHQAQMFTQLKQYSFPHTKSSHLLISLSPPQLFDSHTNKTTNNMYPNNNNNNKGNNNKGICLLALPDDDVVLNPLHCFVRKNVEIFTASSDNIAAPSPGRKQKVVIGQVGIRCIHCANSSSKDRIKRAVCYPPTVNGIYHCVSNMKFDHFGACRAMPAALKEEFLALKKACTRKGSGGSTGSNFTAHYYQTSALQIGLVDTQHGIRWNGQVQQPPQERYDSSTRNSTIHGQNQTQPIKHLTEQNSGRDVPKNYYPAPSTMPPYQISPNSGLVLRKKSHQITSSSSNPNFTKLTCNNNSPPSRSNIFDTTSASFGQNDGLSALMIAATEHSYREECKKRKFIQAPAQLPFAPLPSPSMMIMPRPSFRGSSIDTKATVSH